MKNGRVSSVRELASRLDLSVATVSRALNNHPEVSESTRVRVLSLADEIGYVPKVGKRPSNLVGLVYPGDVVRLDRSTFETALLSGIQGGIDEQRFDLAMIKIERDKGESETYSQFFRRKGVRGVIVRTFTPEARAIAERIADEGFPIVVVADHIERPGLNYVCYDSRPDSTLAVEHLAKLGHRRIGLVVHSVLDSDHADRREGYLQGLRQFGFEPDPSIMLSLPAGLESGSLALDRLLTLPEPPTAVYCTDPMTTVGMLQHALEVGVRVPQELSVVGFDDSDTCMHTFPRYTAVCQDAVRLGLEAALWLTRTLTGESAGELRQRWRTTFVVQGSTGLVPGPRPWDTSTNEHPARTHARPTVLADRITTTLGARSAMQPEEK